MALARALTAVRTGVLSHLRVQASLSATQSQAGPASWQCVRGFAGTYIDKNEVTERILNVVKNFEKVDQSKASSGTLELHECMQITDAMLVRQPRPSQHVQWIARAIQMRQQLFV